MATVTAPRDVVVPDIGDFSDVPIIEVHVASGDAVQPEDPLVTLESDKATMDVPAPFAGVVETVMVSVGDIISEGSLLMTVVPAEGDIAAETRVRPAPPEPAPQGLGSREQAVAAPTGAEPAAASRNPYAGPRARRLARELGVDLSRVTGTGRKGRILDSDVRSFKQRPAEVQKAAAADGAALGLIPWPRVDFEKFGPVERRPLTRIKKISGPNLARNWVMIPHVTVHEEADVTELEAFRKRTNEEHAKDEVKVTMVALLLKACVAALKRFPDFNSSLDGDELVVKGYYHLGFAADTPQGLVVPVIRDVDQKGLLDISRELAALSAKARAGRLAPADMSGGTFTVSSLGGIGGTGFTPIINAPEVAILGVNRSTIKPVWTGAEFVPRLMMPLGLSFDHRVVDGAAAARFNAYLASVLADFRRVLL
jgi:pyruvate dehydrogenase E2 component (dihydrolipoamide acetyltransferase)